MSAEQMKAAYSHHFGIPFDESHVFWQKHWEAAWKASRAALVVQLPEVELMAGDDGVESEIMCPRLVIKALEAAGVKVKP